MIKFFELKESGECEEVSQDLLEKNRHSDSCMVDYIGGNYYISVFGRFGVKEGYRICEEHQYKLMRGLTTNPETEVLKR